MSRFKLLQSRRVVRADAKYLNIATAKLWKTVTQPAGMHRADGCSRAEIEINQDHASRIGLSEVDDRIVLVDSCERRSGRPCLQTSRTAKYGKYAVQSFLRRVVRILASSTCSRARSLTNIAPLASRASR